MAVVIKTDGSRYPLDDTGLESLQAAVGGFIEIVALENEYCVCNEEGKTLGMPFNEIATQRCGDRLLPGDYIAGDAVFAGPDEID